MVSTYGEIDKIIDYGVNKVCNDIEEILDLVKKIYEEMKKKDKESIEICDPLFFGGDKVFPVLVYSYPKIFAKIGDDHFVFRIEYVLDCKAEQSDKFVPFSIFLGKEPIEIELYLNKYWIQRVKELIKLTVDYIHQKL